MANLRQNVLQPLMNDRAKTENEIFDMLTSGKASTEESAKKIVPIIQALETELNKRAADAKSA